MKKEELLHASWDTIVTWQEAITNWWLCDAMSKIYTKVLEIAPKKVYPVLKKWNKDKDLWKRRQSIVSLLYYTGTKKKHPPLEDIIALVHPLLEDKEYYVQKAVGWTLREIHTTYPKEGYAYLSDNIKQVSGIAFSPASEKLSVDKKQLLKDKRK
jgi:3-methyladenine DNA glycosylase AlkD